VLADVVGSGLRLVLVGLVIGIGLAVAGLRGISGMLFEIPAVDPATYVAISFLLLFVAGIACYLPARRAARIDPMEALRAE
jgi:putative ABC transport system permease protein